MRADPEELRQPRLDEPLLLRLESLSATTQLTAETTCRVQVVRADGRPKRRLAAGENPTWSPDGQRFAFIDHYRLMTIDRNGKGKRRVSRKGEFVIGAAWSPKSGVIAYVAGTVADRTSGSRGIVASRP